MTLVIRDLALGNQLEEDYFYDEFVGKWIKKRKVKRASNPRVISRKENRLQKQMPRTVNKQRKKNKVKKVTVARKTKRDRPIIRRIFSKRERTPIKKKEVLVKAEATPITPIRQTTMIPLTKREAQVHKNTNKAIQEEHKTKQEELKTKNLENQIEQEAAKTEQIKGQTKMADTSKGLLWVVGILGVVLVVKFVFGSPNLPQTSPSDSQ